MQVRVGHVRVSLKRVLVAGAATICALAVGPQAYGQALASNRVLVRLQPGVNPCALDVAYGATHIETMPVTNVYTYTPPTGVNGTTFAIVVSCNPAAQYAEPDRQMLAPGLQTQRFHAAFDGGLDSGSFFDGDAYGEIDLPNLSGSFSPVVVAVLDTGVDYTHPALAGNLLPGCSFVTPGAVPADIADGLTNIALGHGTMIAGLVTRLLPSAYILPIRVLNADGIGSLVSIVSAINYAVQSGAQVINLSLGTYWQSQALADAVSAADNAGVTVIASAGNDNAPDQQYPAYCPGALGVSSVEPDLTKSPFANYGVAIKVDAPGDSIRSTYWNDGYATWSGTSCSTAFVSGEAAILLAINPLLSPHQLRMLISHNTISVNAANPNYIGELGSGLIDIGAAVTALQAGNIPN